MVSVGDGIARVLLSHNYGVGEERSSFLFSVCRSASKECHARAERKQSKGNSSLGGNPLIAY